MSELRALEERYAYYRRCQVVRKNGVQCKAPAEKGERVCYRHAAQMEATKRELAARKRVLDDAVRMARTAGEKIDRPEQLWANMSGLRWLVFSAAQALAHDEIDCTAAGRLMAEVQRQTAFHRRGAEVAKDGTRRLATDEHRWDRVIWRSGDRVTGIANPGRDLTEALRSSTSHRKE